MNGNVTITQGNARALAAKGEMAGRIQALDWSASPLGPMEQWPQSLRTVVNILLTSRYSMWMAWGPGLTMLYNDSYTPTLGIKHPWALGQPASDVWAEIWPDIGPRIETVLTTGEATYDEGLLLFLERSGFPEETYHTFSYSPLADDTGRINGMLCVVTEETDRFIGERRVETLRDVASALAGANTEREVIEALDQQLARNRKDLPFTLIYLFEDDGSARLVSTSGINPHHLLAVERITANVAAPWPIEDILRQPVPRTVNDLKDLCGAALPCGDWNRPATSAVIVPLRQQGQEQPAGFLVAGLNPYRRYDDDYSGFIGLLAGQIAAGIANARAYEAERRRAEALAEIDRAKTTFFSNVSHELRTPLTLMLSPVDELLASSDGASREHELLELVHRNGLRLQRLVNGLLDFSRIEAGRMKAGFEAVELDRLTEDLASNFRSAMQAAGLEFTIHCDPFPEPVYVDREMWEKIVLNLISNAFKFTFEGRVSVQLKKVGTNAELTVGDTGTGIPAQELPHVFERFHRVEGARGRTIEGTGIGLALVHELVKLHGGSVQAESQVGIGTTFTVQIPLGAHHLSKETIRPPAATPAPGAQAQPIVEEALRWLSASSDGLPVAIETPAGPNLRREKILLADDNADMRDYVRGLLEPHYDVVCVANGTEALQCALAAPPDLVLSDVMMPGLTGFELVTALRAEPRTRTVPVLLLSARAGEESRVEGLAGGADDYLVKPFTARELLARTGAHLAMAKRRQEAEEALRESQVTLQSFYDSSPLLMGIVESIGDQTLAVYCNAAAVEFLGVRAAQLPGSTAEQLGVPAQVEQLWVDHFRRSEKTAQPVHFEYQHPRPSGLAWLSVTVNYLGVSKSGLPRFSFVAEDVTERKQAEERLRQSNDELQRANSDLEQFAYSASHDLQEPLRQVSIFSQLIDKQYAAVLDERGRSYLGYCVEGAQRMEMLIRDLLAYSQAARGAPASPHPVDLDEVLAGAAKNLSTAIAETGAEITSTPLPSVAGDSVPFTHLFQNLLSNALKYRSERTPRIHVSAEPDGAYWRFSVNDNGIGIAQEFRTQIFGIFKRLHNRKEYPGTGIGLAICQKVVERYGGRIWVESEPGQGSTFLFTLPQSPARS